MGRRSKKQTELEAAEQMLPDLAGVDGDAVEAERECERCVEEDGVLQKEKGERIGLTLAAGALTVIGVKAGSAAARAGLRRFIGWRVAAVDGACVTSCAELRAVAHGARSTRITFRTTERYAADSRRSAWGRPVN